MWLSEQMIRGMEDVWLWWAAVTAMSLLLMGWSLHQCDWQRLRRFRAEEDGAAYTMAYILTLPFFILLVAMFIQLSLLLLAKYGTVYAAYAGARSAVVWLPARCDSPDTWRGPVKRSIVQAMTPFASFKGGGGGGSGSGVYLEAANSFAGSIPLNSTYVAAKFADASANTTFTVEPDKPPLPTMFPLIVTVSYRFSLTVPGISRLLSNSAEGPYRYITSEVMIPPEAFVREEKDMAAGMGIEYILRDSP